MSEYQTCFTRTLIGHESHNNDYGNSSGYKLTIFSYAALLLEHRYKQSLVPSITK